MPLETKLESNPMTESALVLAEFETSRVFGSQPILSLVTLGCARAKRKMDTLQLLAHVLQVKNFIHARAASVWCSQRRGDK